ncbi:MAG: hypothetical protein EU544_05275 [Promethearchaeota archaeon]|nr:MAG: hypothetical protein EU544_05275 [Candidatus Lokiarchaeota archaeon]
MKNNEDEAIGKEPDSEASEKEEKKIKKPEKKTQGQMIQEALGLEQGDIQEIEQKLFMARFFDFFSEETLDFIYKDESIQLYQKEISKYLETLEQKSEENKLLRRKLEEKQLFNLIRDLKAKAEAMAQQEGIKAPVDKRLKKISLMVMLPLFAVVFILALLPINIFIVLPLLCVFCMVPQFIRSSIVKKWLQFKEEHKNDFWRDNRDELMELKDFTSEVLNNIRARLLELKVPLQLIKFVLHSRDYENLKLINQRNVRGTMQYFFTFDYPPGMEPFPIPEVLQQTQEAFPQDVVKEKVEKNFIVLTELEAKNGVITQFVPALKDSKSDEINTLLNECNFSKADKSVEEIIPNYSEDLAIYCVCGEIAKIENVQICDWKGQFKFYLMESEICQCDERVYVLSLMDNSAEVPDQFKEIFK